MNDRTSVPRTIKAIVADIESQASRCPHSPALVLHSELRRVVGAAVQGDPNAMRLAAIVTHVPVPAMDTELAKARARINADDRRPDALAKVDS
jgi:hypothetical protein